MPSCGAEEVQMEAEAEAVAGGRLGGRLEMPR